MWLDPEAHPVSLETHLSRNLHPPQGGPERPGGSRLPTFTLSYVSAKVALIGFSQFIYALKRPINTPQGIRPSWSHGLVTRRWSLTPSS